MDITVADARVMTRRSNPSGERVKAGRHTITPDREFTNCGVTAAGESLGIGTSPIFSDDAS